MAENLLGLMFEIFADPSKAEQAMKRFQQETGTGLSNIGHHMGELQSKSGSVQDFLRSHLAGPELLQGSDKAPDLQHSTLVSARQMVPALTAEREAVMNFQASLVSTQGTLTQFAQQHETANAAAQKFGDAMGHNVQRAVTYGKSVKQAAMDSANATVESIAAKALVEAIYSTALGFLLLAEMDFPAAAQAFEAAAMFGGVGGAAAAVGAAIPSGARNGAGARYGRGGGGARGGSGGDGGGEEWTYGAMASSGQTLAPGAQGALPSAAGSLTVSIMGNEEAGQWLATTLNRSVTQQGVNLLSTRSQRGAPVGH